ncbi:MAG: hypothetical protein ACRDOK_23190 [Streptosporangiaceae bacterium]
MPDLAQHQRERDRQGETHRDSRCGSRAAVVTGPADGRTLRSVVAGMGQVANGAPAAYLGHVPAARGPRPRHPGRGP